MSGAPIDDYLAHFLAVFLGSLPFLGGALLLWRQWTRDRSGNAESMAAAASDLIEPYRKEVEQMRQQLVQQEKRIAVLERRVSLKARIIQTLLDELRRLVPDWKPSPELAAELAELQQYHRLEQLP